MKTFLSLIISVVALCGCAKKSEVNNILNSNGVYKNSSAKYLALGDSYTIGQSVPLDMAFPYQLTRLFGNEQTDAPTIIAATGWTTTNLMNAIDQSGISGQKFEFVTLLIGVNDQYQGKSIESYSINFEKLVKTAIELANNSPERVLVLSIPDYSVTPFAASSDRQAIATDIDQFNRRNKQISDANNVNYLDITDISRRAKSEPDLLADDGLHPSGKMYGLWVQRIEPLARIGLSK